ncbi:MAG TPA: hypothetical protein VN230_05175 [Burkholderiaceae bacterium]|nr:hypothetical protein [Burkholderiaceae bacterium]
MDGLTAAAMRGKTWLLGLGLGAICLPGLALAQLAFLLEDEESPAIERELRRGRLGQGAAPAGQPGETADAPLKWSGVYGLSASRSRSRSTTVNLPLALQADLPGRRWSFAVESDGLTWQREPGQSTHGFNDVDVWTGWSDGAWRIKAGLSLGSRSVVGSDFDRAFVHLYRKWTPTDLWKFTGVLSLRRRLDSPAPDRHPASAEFVVEGARTLPGHGALQSLLLKATHVLPEGRPGHSKVRAGVDLGLAGGTFTPFATWKRKPGASQTELGFDLTWEY